MSTYLALPCSSLSIGDIEWLLPWHSPLSSALPCCTLLFISEKQESDILSAQFAAKRKSVHESINRTPTVQTGQNADVMRHLSNSFLESIVLHEGAWPSVEMTSVS